MPFTSPSPPVLIPDLALTVVFHAVARLGAVLTTANPTYTAEEMAFQLEDAAARVLFTTSALLDRARDAVRLSGRARGWSDSVSSCRWASNTGY